MTFFCSTLITVAAVLYLAPLSLGPQSFPVGSGAQRFTRTTELTSSSPVISANFATYGTGPYWAYNSVWNKGTLENGSDFIQTLTLTPSDFPAGTTIAWSWPDAAAVNNVYSFPELAYGVVDAGGASLAPSVTPLAKRIRSFTKLSVKHDVTIEGESNHFDVIYDGYLTAGPNAKKVFEFTFFIHTPPYAAQYVTRILRKSTCDFSGVSWYLALDASQSLPHLLFMPSAAEDILDHTIDVKAGFSCATKSGITTGSEYISGIELGAEPQMSTGLVVVKAYEVGWQ